jgi:hypothetical protein
MSSRLTFKKDQTNIKPILSRISSMYKIIVRGIQVRNYVLNGVKI